MTPPISHRGVWLAPWVGATGELVVYSVDHRNHIVRAPAIIPHGADVDSTARSLWDELDAADPVAPHTPRAPRSTLVLDRRPSTTARAALELIR